MKNTNLLAFLHSEGLSLQQALCLLCISEGIIRDLKAVFEQMREEYGVNGYHYASQIVSLGFAEKTPGLHGRSYIELTSKGKEVSRKINNWK